MLEGRRIVRASGVHIPIWPFDIEILVRYQAFPTVTSASKLIKLLTGMVEAGIVHDKTVPA